jgi:hypothetical protein
MESQVAEPHDPPSSLPHSRSSAGDDRDKGREDWNSKAFDLYGELTDPYRESQW